MSQGNQQHPGLRAVFAVTAVCALLFSLFISGAIQGARAEAISGDAGFSQAAPCPMMLGAAVEHASAGHKGGGHTGKVDCPFCCLAAQAGAAVIPDRLGSVVRPPRIVSSPIVYVTAAAHDPQTAVANAANAARAPPAL
jgi:hypothetical protein